MMCVAPPELRLWHAARLAAAERAVAAARIEAGRHPVTGEQLAFRWSWNGRELVEVPWTAS